MISKCCKAKPLFSLGYAHGVKMYDDTYFGVCSKCSEESEFIIEGEFPPKKGCIYKEIEEHIQRESEVE
mgnify:CR=1 FL=1